jgi:hypothetical protein
VQLRSAENAPGDSAMTGPDGRHQLRIVRSGEYYLGVNLNRTPTRDTPYPRWCYPGTGDPASAIKIEFSGRPEFRTYDFVLPDRQPDRIIQGVVLKGDGQPMSRAVISALDAAQTFGASDFRSNRAIFATGVRRRALPAARSRVRRRRNACLRRSVGHRTRKQRTEPAVEPDRARELTDGRAPAASPMIAPQ